MPVARVDDPARADAPAEGRGRRRGGGVGGANLEARAPAGGRAAGDTRVGAARAPPPAARARRGTRAWVPLTRDACTRARARAADPACDVEQDMVLVGVCVGGDPARALFGAFFSKHLH